MRRLITGLAVLVFVTGCSDAQTVARLEAELGAAKKDLAEMKEVLAGTITKVDSLDSEVKFGKMREILSRNDVAFLKPGDSGYTLVQANVGSLAFSFEDVKPFANGSKVRLQVGNLTSARIDGLKGKLDWGKMTEKDGPDNERAKTKEFSLIENLRQGAWTNIELVLEGTPPAELGFVRLMNIGHRAISLSR